MALVSSKALIAFMSLYHITLGIIFLSNPLLVKNHSLVQILGQSMRIPPATGFDAPSAPLSLLALVLTFFGLTDLLSLAMPELAALHYWALQAPTRAFLSIILTIYVYASSPSSPASRGAFAGTRASPPAESIWGEDGVANRLVFAFAFLEMLGWFWAWVALMEEKQGVAHRAKAARLRRGD